ncbi:MAG: SOS response-associated peptidase [Vulcanimicrobiaceae bacterium]
MCGRFTLTRPEALRRVFPRFTFEEFSEYRLPRFNIAPAQTVIGVRNDGRDRVEAMHWGIDRRINARAETVAGRRTPRRCIVFADGFFEWKARQPVYFTMRDGSPFAVAGVWQPGRDGPASCAIVTCPPNELVASVHDRMPVVLPGSAIELWLSQEELALEPMRAMLRAYDAAAMSARPVSMRVNNARYDAADLLSNEDATSYRYPGTTE